MKHFHFATFACVAAVLVAKGCSDRDRSAHNLHHEQESRPESDIQTEWLPGRQRSGDELPRWLKASQAGELLQLKDESVIGETLTSTSLALLVFTAWSKDQRLSNSDPLMVNLLADYARVHRLPIFEVPLEFFADSGRMAAERFGVRSAPMVLVFLRGKEIGRASAPRSRESLVGFEQDIEKILIGADVSLPDKRAPVTEANHDAFVSGNETVLLFFTAPWCSVCKHYYPNVRNLSVNAPGLRVGVINVDESPALAKERYNVKAIPAFVVLEDGVERQRSIGPDADLIFDLYPIGRPSSAAFKHRFFRLMSVNDLSEVPEEGVELLIVVRQVGDDTLHFRAFNGAGERVLDKSETQIPDKSTEIEALKEALADLWDRLDQQTATAKQRNFRRGCG